MNIQVNKAWRELAVHPGRSLFTILGLIVGLWGVGLIAVSYVILSNDLRENYLRTEPAHVIISADNLDTINLNDFKNRYGIESAEFRDLSYHRIEVHPNQWIPLWLYGVENFNSFNLAKLFPQQGKVSPTPGSILVERNGLLISTLKIDSVANIRVNIASKAIPISGIVFDPAQAPATQDAFIYAYTDKKTFADITGDTINKRLIFRLKNVTSKSQIELATTKIVENLNSQGIKIKNISIPKFNEHPHQFQLNTLLVLQGSIGLLAFFMGVVMVSQLIAAILAQQQRQIGVLKAIGATSCQVFRIYFIMVLMLGAISSVIAIPLAVISGFAFAEFVARIINFNIITDTLPIHTYLILITTGLLLPAVLSLPAILRGIRVSPYKALNDYGVCIEATTHKKYSGKPALSYGIGLAFRNTMRRKQKLVVTIISMALGVAIFNTGFNVREALFVFLAKSRDAMQYDVQVVLKDQIIPEQALLPFQSLENISHIEIWNGGRGRLQTSVVATLNGVGIVALPYNTNLIKWDVMTGRWLENNQELEIVMNQKALEDLGKPDIGSIYPIEIEGIHLAPRLVGVVKEFDVAKIYIDKEQYDALLNPGHRANSLMFVAKNNSYHDVLELKKNIEKQITVSDLNVLYVLSQAERAQIIYDHLDIILSLITFLALLVLLVSALGMAASASIHIMERTREIGVMRAIGATPSMIYLQFVREGMIVSAISIAIGLCLAWPLSHVASTFFGSLILGEGATLDFAFSYMGLLVTLLVTILFAWLASRIPARRAIKVSTREALAYA